MVQNLPETRTESSAIQQLNDLSIMANPYPLYTSLRKSGPLYLDHQAGMWICTGYNEAETILCDPQGHFGVSRLRSNEQLRSRGVEKLIPIYSLLRPQMSFQDDPQHRMLRTAMQRRFPAIAPFSFYNMVQAFVNERLAPFVCDQHANSMDLVDDFAGTLPTQVAASVLGLPLSDLVHFLRWNDAYEEALARFAQPSPLRLRKQREGLEHQLQEEKRYFDTLVRARLDAPQDDLISDMLQAFVQEQTTPAEAEAYLDVIAANCILLLASGYTTTTNLIAQALLWLWREPSQRQLLEEDPSRIEAVISETMRLSGSTQYVTRLALHDAVVGKKRIRRGQTVLIMLGAVNLDEQVFPDPQAFLLTRTKKQLEFGMGHHFCIDIPHTALLAQIAISSFLQHFPAFKFACEDLEWGKYPNVRTLLHAPVLLDSPEKQGNTTVPDHTPLSEDSVETVPEQRMEPFTITTSDEGLTTLRFDPTLVVLSFDLQRGVIAIANKIRATASRDEQLLRLGHSPDEQASEELSEAAVHQQIQELFAAVVDIPIGEVSDCSDFFDAGSDVELVSLLSAIKQHFEVELDPEVVYDHPILADLAAVIVETANRMRTPVQKREVVHS